jgi:GNAT superfamily N-acetyltransferase
MHVRPATLGDLETVVRYNAAIARETESKELDLDTLQKGVAAALRKPDECRYFLAEIDGRIVGQAAITFEWSDWRNGRFWWLQSVYVEAEYRRQGVFTAIFNYIRALAHADAEACGLRLYVEEQNTRAHQTYRHMGLEPTGYVVLEDCWKSFLSGTRGGAQ